MCDVTDQHKRDQHNYYIDIENAMFDDVMLASLFDTASDCDCVTHFRTIELF